MTLAYHPGDSFVHRLDARAKLAAQTTIALAAFVHTTPEGVVVVGVLTAGILLVADTGPLSTLRELRLVLPFLIAGPLVEAATWGEPWIVLADARDPFLASIRVLLLLFVGAVYVRTTPVRESRAAIDWLVPGRPGRILGAGVGFVFRFLPVLQRDVGRIRSAIRARLGDQRRLHERMQTVGIGALRRTVDRADGLALALRARCFAWNPTLPDLRFGRRDAVPILVSVALAVWAAAPLIGVCGPLC